MRVAIVTTAAAAVAATAFVAFAAQLGLAPANAGAGATPISRCDTDGFTVSYGLTGPNVSSVTVGGIADPACEGASVTVTLTSTGGSSIGSGTGTVPTDGDALDNTVVVATSPTPAEVTVTGIQIVLVGP
jgi:hypothetical protein